MSEKEYREKKGEKSPLAQKEEQILAFWKKNNIFEKSLARTVGNDEFIFYEGPPTSNGRPGIHHVESRAFKDAIPRYKTMRGMHVRRKGGWDTHGLPVELEVEKELGMTSKKDVEAYGIEAFNKKCKESVWKYVSEWQAFTDRMGYWTDQDNPYITYKPDYIESLWNIVGVAEEKGLLYKDYKVLPWCPRCGTALSSHELAQGYETVKDLSVYIAFKRKDADEYFLAWTTTPWTLPGNVALAVGKDIDYVLVSWDGKSVWVAKDRLEVLLPEGEILKEAKGRELVGLGYEPLYPYMTDVVLDDQKENLSNAFKVYSADFVTTTDGTGIVHIAVMYGQDDFVLGTKIGLPKVHLVNPEGRFISGTDFLKGKFVKDEETTIDIIKDLAGKGVLLKKEKYEHTYPHCWRCKTPLIYYARDSWYIRMSELRDDLVVENREINWEPEHIREGRFGEWLSEVKDWAISRERYWATPLPVWVSEDEGTREVIASREELRTRVPEDISKIFILRHAESEKNVQKVYDNSLDEFGLTEEGKKSAHITAERLRREGIDILFSSPVRRAKETADIIAGLLDVEVQVAEELREIDSGEWEGKTIGGVELGEAYTKREALSDEEYYEYPYGVTGESLADVERRSATFVKKVIRENPGKKITFVSHQGVNISILKALKGWDETFTRKEYQRQKACRLFAEPTEIFVDREREVELDLHRPYVDRFVWKNKSGQVMRRVNEVMDVWFDSGAMPFAQDHYPFENKEYVNSIGFPADFISEAIDQTRGWFYTLHAVGAIMGKGKAYRNVISLGHILDAEGKKMSKSKGNGINPWDAMDTYGIDPVRFWMYSVNQPGDSKNFDEETVHEVLRKVFNLADNVVKFYEMFKAQEHADFITEPSHVLDKWIFVSRDALVREVTDAMEKYDLFRATREIREFIGDLSQWYVRRSRDRMKDGDGEALGTLRTVLFDLARVMAPFAPFFAEDMYKRVGGKKESVHLEHWPDVREVDANVLKEMEVVRNVISLALEKRAQTGMKVRQPLAKLTIPSEISDEYKEIVKDELNVKEVIVGTEMTLDIELTSELKDEGAMREITRAVQALRKSAGLNPEDKVILKVQTDDTGKALIEKWSSELSKTAGLGDISFVSVDEGTEIIEYNYAFVVSL